VNRAPEDRALAPEDGDVQVKEQEARANQEGGMQVTRVNIFVKFRTFSLVLILG